jgi:two-component sensor histidine kinase
MAVVVKNGRPVARQDGPVDELGKLRERALRVSCANEADTIVQDIILRSDAPTSDRGRAVLDIVLSREDLPPIQIRAITQLVTLDPTHARELIGHLVKRPFDEDREHVRARAYAALAELPDTMSNDVQLLAAALSSKSRTVREAITRSLEGQSTNKLQSLKTVAEQLHPATTPPIGTLKAALESALCRSNETQMEPARVTHVSSMKPRQKPKQSKASTPHPTEERKPAVAIPRGVETQEAQRSDTAATPPPIPISSPTVSPSTQKNPSVFATTMRISLPPRPVEGENSEELESLRERRFDRMTWTQLLTQRDNITDPHELCACFTVMTARFGVNVTREAVASKLTWLLSHPEPDLKRKATLIFKKLF